ncbi:MAG: SAM-dependent methyltransferase [Anaerolineae bacterium]|nr:SAM-dependent methyltransferase [Anaerolineae bacterium]
MLEKEYQQWVKDSITDEARFVKAVFSGRQHGYKMRWRRMIIRPVILQSKRHWQVSHFDEKQDISKNYTAAEIDMKLDELLALPFSHLTLHTTERESQVRFSKKGKIFVRHKKTDQSRTLPDLAHDHKKDVLLSIEESADFLQTIGLLSAQGKIKSSMRRKYRQINEFLRLIVETHALEKITHSPLNIIDFGCGSAHLTFAVYHYFNHILHMPARVMGVDIKADLMEKQKRLTAKLGWQGIEFQTTSIIGFKPEVSPDIVMALHACDTATDEALAQAVRWNSYMIFSAPCCHHNLQEQLDKQATPQIFTPVLRHGILKERLGDVLTDTFRAQLLRVMGYRTDVIEFVSAEHTDKNLMIRGVKTITVRDPQIAAEYRDLKTYWGVQPYLEHLLANELGEIDISQDPH